MLWHAAGLLSKAPAACVISMRYQQFDLNKDKQYNKARK